MTKPHRPDRDSRAELLVNHLLSERRERLAVRRDIASEVERFSRENTRSHRAPRPVVPAFVLVIASTLVASTAIAGVVHIVRRAQHPAAAVADTFCITCEPQRVLYPGEMLPAPDRERNPSSATAAPPTATQHNDSSGGPDAATQATSVRDSAGVRVVTNRAAAWGSTPAVRLELVRSYGSLDTRDPNLQFHFPRDVGVDAAGNVYIFDSGGKRIQVFDSRGAYLRTTGRWGQGPGELNNPAYFGVTRSGEITLVSQGQLQIIDAAGRETQRRRFEVPVAFPGGRVIHDGEWIVDAGNGIWGGHPRYDPAAERSRPLIRIMDRNGTTLRSHGAPDFHTIDGLEVAIRSVFVAEAPGGGLYLNHGYRNLIERVDANGRVTMRITRPPRYEQVLQFIRNGQHLDYDVSAISEGLEVDHRGRIWSQTFTRRVNSGLYSSRVDWSAPMFTFEVFDSNGVLLGAIPPQFTFSSFRIFGDRLFLIDQYADMRVHEFRIE